MSGDEEYGIFEESSNRRPGTQTLFLLPFKMERGNELNLAGEKHDLMSVGELPTPPPPPQHTHRSSHLLTLD